DQACRGKCQLSGDQLYCDQCCDAEPELRGIVMDLSAFAYGRREHGQTILLVALSMTALLAMAAISIDVVTLYVARGEAQHSAEAAALAGAKAFVTSGYTSYPTGFGNTSALCSGTGSGLAKLQSQAA